MNKKNLRMAGMGIVALAMVGWMGYDFLSQSAPPPISNDVQTEVVEPEVVIDTTVTPVMMAEPEEADTAIIDPTPTVSFTLSNRAQTVLDALEETYVSQVTDAKLTAQIAAKVRQNELDQLVGQPRLPKDNTPTTIATIDLLTVKSIVSTPNRITAWIDIQGQTMPIQRGAWVDDVRALNITKDFVRFVNKQGQEFTKYVDTPLPTVSEKEDGKVR